MAVLVLVVLLGGVSRLKSEPAAQNPGPSAPEAPAAPVPAAPASCADSIEALKPALKAVTDPKRREEARLLLEKAAIDDSHGRPLLCKAAVEKAAKVLQ